MVMFLWNLLALLLELLYPFQFSIANSSRSSTFVSLCVHCSFASLGCINRVMFLNGLSSSLIVEVFGFSCSYLLGDPRNLLLLHTKMLPKVETEGQEGENGGFESGPLAGDVLQGEGAARHGRTDRECGRAGRGGETRGAKVGENPVQGLW